MTVSTPATETVIYFKTYYSQYGRSVEMCLLCQSAVKVKERRKLHSDSTEHVLPILLEMSGALETPATETVFYFNSLHAIRHEDFDVSSPLPLTDKASTSLPTVHIEIIR